MKVRSIISACLPLAGAILTLAMVAACGAVSASGPGSPTPSPSPTVVVAGDADKGKTLNMHVGDRLEVKLGSTYWDIAGSSNPGVLQSTGPATVSPLPGGCVPGQGCGVVSEKFAAVAPGAATVTASRTSCGEAMRCTGADGLYLISIEVTR